MKRRALLSPLVGLALAGCSVFGIRSGYEQPDYEVVEQIEDDVEIRRYGPQLAVETVASSDDVDDARSTAFTRLFDYISGDNTETTEVAMTAPVESMPTSARIAMTAPVESRASADGVRMRFFLPATFTMASAPVPTHEAVDLIELPPRTLAVLRFSGRWTDDVLQARSDDLLQSLRTSDWQIEGEPFRMFYDPPFALPWFRRNEVAVEVSRKSS